MKYKCTSQLHVWGWTDFMKAIKGKIVSYEFNDGIINSITYEVENLIDKKVCKEFGVDFKLLKE